MYNKSDLKVTDLLIYTVAYAFMVKATRISTINCKGQCGIFSRTFRLIDIKDKSSEVCIDAIEQITSNITQLKDISYQKDCSY